MRIPTMLLIVALGLAVILVAPAASAQSCSPFCLPVPLPAAAGSIGPAVAVLALVGGLVVAARRVRHAGLLAVGLIAAVTVASLASPPAAAQGCQPICDALPGLPLPTIAGSATVGALTMLGAAAGLAVLMFRRRA